jgi:type I restriction enzyme S subunit
MRARLIAVAQEYLDGQYGDANAEQRLCSSDTHTYWQQLSEVLLGYQLTDADIAFSHQAAGPDFRIDHEGRRIWVEVITPTPANIPAEWISPVANGVHHFPHEEILLRWTAAIKQKAEVLLGNPPGVAGYLANGIVGSNDIYVIAVNGRLLRGFDGAFDELIGISQFPFAVEATLAIGPLQIRIDRETFEASEPQHQERFLIKKPKGEPVPADTFLDARYAPISAIWATDVDEFSLLDRPARMVVVHNPGATVPLPIGLLPAQEEYVARIRDQESYELNRVDGRTAGTTSVVE